MMINQYDSFDEPIGKWDGVWGESHYKGTFHRDYGAEHPDERFTGYVQGNYTKMYLKNGVTFGMKHYHTYTTQHIFELHIP